MEPGPVLRIEPVLKIQVYYRCWTAVVGICTGTRIEENQIPDVLDANTGIVNAKLTCTALL